jgi:hypothetical protein
MSKVHSFINDVYSYGKSSYALAKCYDKGQELVQNCMIKENIENLPKSFNYTLQHDGEDSSYYSSMGGLNIAKFLTSVILILTACTIGLILTLLLIITINKNKNQLKEDSFNHISLNTAFKSYFKHR